MKCEASFDPASKRVTVIDHNKPTRRAQSAPRVNLESTGRRFSSGAGDLQLGKMSKDLSCWFPTGGGGGETSSVRIIYTIRFSPRTDDDLLSVCRCERLL